MAKPPPVIPSPKRFVFFRPGVRVPFGTDAAVHPHGVNARELAVPGNPLEDIKVMERRRS